MDKQKFNRTAASLEEISTALKKLKQTTESKKYALSQQRQSYKQNLADKHTQIETLQKAISGSLEKIGAAVAKIDRVIEEDGSSNNQN